MAFIFKWWNLKSILSEHKVTVFACNAMENENTFIKTNNRSPCRPIEKLYKDAVVNLLLPIF